ncbi:hypothetical protein [Lentzea fradiae]|nr:hypothetical protein [Lentzea fradiae]
MSVSHNAEPADCRFPTAARFSIAARRGSGLVESLGLWRTWRPTDRRSQV